MADTIDIPPKSEKTDFFSSGVLHWPQSIGLNLLQERTELQVNWEGSWPDNWPEVFTLCQLFYAIKLSSDNWLMNRCPVNMSLDTRAGLYKGR